MKTQVITFLSVLFLMDCAGDQSSTTNLQNDTIENELAKECTYSYNPEATEVNWVAYKFTDRKGVAGKFDSISMTGIMDAESPELIMSGAAFEIFTGSTNTGDASRDPKIKNSFFGKLSNGNLLSGKVSAIEGDAASGNVTFSLKMNGVEKPVEGSYKIVEENLEVKAEIDVNDWMAQDAIANLNKECLDLHKGADGQSKLWSEVSIFISTRIEKNCN